MEAKLIDHYRDLAPELLFKNYVKSKVYQYGEARMIKLASIDGLEGIIEAAAYVIVLKANGDNWFLLYEGGEETDETFLSLDTDLSQLLNIDIKITVDLLNVFLLQEPDEGLVERMMIEVSKVWYLNLQKSEMLGSGSNTYGVNGIEEVDGNEEADGTEEVDGIIEGLDGIEEVDGNYIYGMSHHIPKHIQVTRQVSKEERLWDEAFSVPLLAENATPSVKKAESLATKLLMVEDTKSTLEETDSASVSLIEAVEQENKSIVLQLLLLGSNPNQRRPLNDDTALHVAVRKGNEVIVKLLLAFKADPNIVNKNNETPFNLAEMHADREIYSLIEKVDSLQTKTRKYFTLNSSLPAERTRAGTYLMSLDGGGIRGFNTTTFLIALEDRMKELSPKCLPIQYYFDYIAGTSSGAIAALILLYTNYSLRIGQCLVYQILTKVFTLKSIEKRKNSMETNLQSIFKEKTLASLRDPPHAIVTTTKHPRKLSLMTSYDEGEAGSNQQVWKAARMSSAAPFIFPPVDGIYLDGGLVANNPTNAALEEISRIEQNCEFGCILSIGTGFFENPKLFDNLEYFYSTFPFDQLRNPFELTKTIKTFIQNSYGKVKESSEESAKSLCETKGWEYHRWSPPLNKNLGSACTELDIIIDMMYHTEMHILQHPETIDGIAKCILAKKPAN